MTVFKVIMDRYNLCLKELIFNFLDCFLMDILACSDSCFNYPASFS